MNAIKARLEKSLEEIDAVEKELARLATLQQQMGESTSDAIASGRIDDVNLIRKASEDRMRQEMLPGLIQKQETILGQHTEALKAHLQEANKGLFERFNQETARITAALRKALAPLITNDRNLEIILKGALPNVDSIMQANSDSQICRFLRANETLATLKSAANAVIEVKDAITS
jgi:hypothetical protein